MGAQPQQMQGIYLSKNGKSVGPFTDAEITAMKKSGELYDYTFIWDLASGQWKPVEPPPPPPGAAASSAAPVPPPAELAPAPAAKREPRPAPELKEIKIPSIDAVCFDQLSVVSGQLAHVTQQGCELLSNGHEPHFATRGKVTLNLLNPKTGKAMNVPARLEGIRRSQGSWAISLRWDECPEILL